MTNKQHIPRKIEDLEKIYYGENRDGTNVDFNSIKRYEDNLKTKIITPSNEKEIIEIFEPIGKAVKIPEKANKKTIDFRIDEGKILIEVTSLDFGTDKKILVTENKVISKIQEAVSHIVEKDVTEFQNYYKGGVIFYTTLFNFLSKIGDLLRDNNFMKKLGIFNNNLDFIVFLPEPASINGRSSREINPPMFFCKNKDLLKLFSERFKNKGYEIISV